VVACYWRAKRYAQPVLGADEVVLLECVVTEVDLDPVDGPVLRLRTWS
jgi:hypothetical protein